MSKEKADLRVTKNLLSKTWDTKARNQYTTKIMGHYSTKLHCHQMFTAFIFLSK